MEQLYLIVTLKTYELHIYVGLVSNLITFHDGQLCMNTWRIMRWQKVGCILLNCKTKFIFFVRDGSKKILDICFFLSIIIYIEKIKISFSKVGKNWRLENARINF